MMILKENNYEYYLCNEQNFLYLEISYLKNWSWWKEEEPLHYKDVYELLLGYELGSYEYLFDEVKWFEHIMINRRISGITPTEEFFKNYKALARDIQIDNIINDFFND